MLLTLSTTHRPATDLGYLLHKHPDRFQAVSLSIGKAHIFYPESSEEKTTVALLLDIDPIALVRGGRDLSRKGFSLGQYVNDRPYVASSFMSVALSEAFGTAMNGRCNERPELVEAALPFMVKIAVIPAPKGGEGLIRNLFEPLGYEVNVLRHGLDSTFPEWGESKYYTLELSHQIPLKLLLSHLYVLIPVLDNEKHYYVSQSEIDKLLKKGEGWLATHPQKEQITRRYLINLRSLSRRALSQLVGETEEEEQEPLPESEKKRKESLHQKRLNRVLEEVKKSEATSILDLGCGEGKLLRMLLKERQFTQIVGMDVSYKELVKAKERLHWDEMPPKQKERITLFQGALHYRDKRLSGFDIAVLVEVIEHMEEDRLDAMERVVFEFAQPKRVIITTPNAEYNIVFESMQEGSMRHEDHRFEWTREQFQTWSQAVAERNGYQVTFYSIGEEKEEVGAPSQMAVFTYGT